jgi:hypothetical protein
LRPCAPSLKTNGESAPHSNLIYYFFFPATFILSEGDHANVFTVLPESAGSLRVFGTRLAAELPKTEKSISNWEKIGPQFEVR